MTETVLQKLQSVGVVNIVDFVGHDLDVLATKSGVGYRDLAAIRRVLVSEHAAPVVAGSSLFDVVVSTTSIVSAGSSALDNLLEGGIFTGEITEVISDRSVVCDALVMNTVLTVVTAMSKNVMFIDTSNRFDASRLSAMLASQPNVDVETALKRVRVVKCFDVLELLSKLSILSDSQSTSNDSFYSSLKLVIVDGIVDCIVPLLSHIHNNAGCGYIAQLVCQFRLLTTDFGYAVLLCNGDGRSVTSKNTTVPKMTALGMLWCSVPDTRLDVVEVTGESNQCGIDNTMAFGQIKITLSKSNRLPVGPCVELKVNELGLYA